MLGHAALSIRLCLADMGEAKRAYSDDSRFWPASARLFLPYSFLKRLALAGTRPA